MMPAAEINRELVSWARANLPRIPHYEGEFYDKKISGMVIRPGPASFEYETIMKQKARDYDKMSLHDYKTPKEFMESKAQALRGILGKTNGRAYVESPMFVNFGYNIYVGKNFYANFNCTFLDWSVIRIGDNVAIGPGTTLTTVNHSLDGDERATRPELFAYPIIIEDKVWIGAGCVILSGVTIGSDSVVAAGSVVTRDVPPKVVVAGNPARVIAKSTGRKIIAEDEPVEKLPHDDAPELEE